MSSISWHTSPLHVIAELLGAPVEDRHKIFDWSNRIAGNEDPEFAVDADSVTTASTEMYLYAQKLAAERREHPREDIATTLISAEVDGDQLTEHEFNLFFLLLSIAGNETTRYTLTHALHAFLEHPDQYDMLVGDRTLLDNAVEEILRWATPVMYFRRNATEDYELRGQRIRAGDTVSLWYISANRDEDVFDSPFSFDIRRHPNHHIGFGGGGPHFCLGASLARLQLRVFFEEFMDSVARVELLGQPVRLRSNLLNGIKHLPVRLHPAT